MEWICGFVDKCSYNNESILNPQGSDKDVLFQDVKVEVKNLKDTLISLMYITQLSINGVGLIKPLTTSLNQTSKHLSHLRKPSRVVGRGEVGITGY